MCSITCLAELALLYILPAKFTVDALVLGKAQVVEQKKWAVFWALFSIFVLIESLLPFLKSAPFVFLKTLFVVWLYHPEFLGSLLISQIIEQKLKPLSGKINGILSKLSFLHLVDEDASINTSASAAMNNATNTLNATINNAFNTDVKKQL